MKDLSICYPETACTKKRVKRYWPVCPAMILLCVFRFRVSIKQSKHIESACCSHTRSCVCVQTAPEAEERDKEHMRLG